jgi:serine/threonine protein kinase
VDELLARYPDLADELRECLASLAFIRRAGNLSVAPDASAEGEGTEGVLGDFRIVREVGRGGMGVVYEAEHISLRRRVALKVLPFAATMDPRHLQRFHNEAQAAACLHHTNIVPVHFVGCERGVHFYAMQFIDGQSLAELIAVQRHTSAIGAASTPCAPGALTKPIAIATTQAAPRDAAHYRRIAEWGIQAAEALEYAHSLGIVHRDIKPSNLMIDGAGKLWVTDFGLARTATDAGLTMTGDVVGTLRYMSPEQALAKHGLVDHRTDLYALGATLYEALTLRPAIDGKDREESLRKIAFEEPPPPRSLEHTIPVDLEIIVLKALAKEPAERYASAQELADDLRFFLHDKPIRAKRPSRTKRALKYLRRHQSIAWTACIGLMVALFILSVCSLLLWQEKERVKFALVETETQSRLATEHAASAENRRLRADANLDMVLNGLTMILDRLDDREWPRLVSIEAVQQAIADHIERFFHQRVAGQANDPLNKWEIGWVFLHLGHYYLRRSDHVRAEKHFRIALAIHEAVVNEQPDDRSHVAKYAQSLKYLAIVLHVTGRTEEAHNYYLRAREQLRRQLEMQPDREAYDELAFFLAGCLDAQLVDTAEAERLASRAVE